MTAKIYRLAPRYNATRNKTTYGLVGMDDGPEVDRRSFMMILTHAQDRLRSAGFGVLLDSEHLQTEVIGTAMTTAETVEDLDYQVTFTTKEGGEFGVCGIRLHEGEILHDSGLFIEG